MKDLYSILDQIGIDYLKHEHPAVYTCEEAEKYYQNIQGGKSKNLFLRNKKGDQHYLLVLEAEKRVDLKELAKLLGESKLSFASEERLLKYLGLTKGSVSPFGLINDENKEVSVVIDNDLMKHERLHYHPNINTATLELSREDFKKFLEWTKNTIQYFDI